MPTTIDSAGITFTDTTSLTSANIGTNQIINNAVTAAKLGTTEQKQIAKAWVNFNGTTSPGTIRAQYNVSSVTKNGTGDYTMNFTTAMSDANYSAAFMGGDSQTTNTGTWGSPYLTKTTSQFRFQTTTWSSNRILWDVDNSSVQIFGN